MSGQWLTLVGTIGCFTRIAVIQHPALAIIDSRARRRKSPSASSRAAMKCDHSRDHWRPFAHELGRQQVYECFAPSALIEERLPLKGAAMSTW